MSPPALGVRGALMGSAPSPLRALLIWFAMFCSVLTGLIALGGETRCEITTDTFW